LKNKNTTVLGIAAILSALCALLTALFDGDPATSPDYTSAIAAAVAGLGLIFAKDAANKE